MTAPRRDPVVITGIGVISALGPDADSFWTGVCEGVGAVGPAVESEVAGVPGAFVGEVPAAWLLEHFDADAVADRDRAGLLAVTAAREALRSAGLGAADLPAGRCGLVIGKCQAPGPSRGSYLPIHATMADVADDVGATGPRVMVSTACAAGANAVGMGRDLLWDDEADVVLAGGVDVVLATTYAGFAALQALAPAPCAPYSRSDGLSLGEGAAFLVLERASGAEERGARILADVRGYGLSADAYHPTAPDPTGRGAVTAVIRALRDADAKLADVTYVNGHGTGTPTNDRMERKAMRTLFGDDATSIPLSGTKSFLGHTLGASGAIEAVVCTLAIRDDLVPPTANVDPATPVTDELDVVAGRARAALVDLTVSTNYAFGGNNAALALSKHRTGAVAPAARPDDLDDLVITGWGPIGALGLGVDAWDEAFSAGRSGIDPRRRAAPMVGSAPRPSVDPKLWRQMSELGRQCVAASSLACSEAGLAMTKAHRDEVALVFATAYGPVLDAISFDVGHGTAPKVSAFANITMNSPAGAVSRALGLRGPTTTITMGATSFFHAIAAATDLIRFAGAPAAIVLAADELSDELLAIREAMVGTDHLSVGGRSRPLSRSRDGVCPGHGVVACVLEPKATARARGARIWGELGPVARSSARSQVATRGTGDVESYAGVLRSAVERSGSVPDDVGVCVGLASGAPRDVVEAEAMSRTFGAATMVAAPLGLTGECGAASGAVALFCASMAVSGGSVPALDEADLVDELTLRPVRPGDPPPGVELAVAAGRDDEGDVAAVVVRAERTGDR